MDRAGFAATLEGVDPAKLDRIAAYVAHLEKWQRAINLVGPKTLADTWRRHILDSAQLIPLLPEPAAGQSLDIADLGSGAGLPGLVIAILTDTPVQMIESDQRKAVFIREAARITATSVVVHNARIEDVAPLNADVVTARALAPLERLLPWVARHLGPNGKTLLLKGADVDDELTLSAKKWTMKLGRKQSLSSTSGTVLVIEELAPITDD